VKSSSFVSAIVALLLLGAALFAMDRYVRMEQAHQDLNLRNEELDEARRLLRTFPDTFVNTGTDSPVDLKTIIQQSSARNGIAVMYLSETERDAGEKIKERSVIARLVNVPHQKLVTFLQELEQESRGARIKELRLKPSANRSDVYQEAESVLAIRWLNERSEKKEEAR